MDPIMANLRPRSAKPQRMHRILEEKREALQRKRLARSQCQSAEDNYAQCNIKYYSAVVLFVLHIFVFIEFPISSFHFHFSFHVLNFLLHFHFHFLFQSIHRVGSTRIWVKPRRCSEKTLYAGPVLSLLLEQPLE